MNSRAKGCRGEREWRDFLRSKGLTARRGQQFSGCPEAPDVICEDLCHKAFHAEVKKEQQFKGYQWLDQAKSESGGKVPYVAWRRDHKDWMILLSAEDFIQLIKGEV